MGTHSEADFHPPGVPIAVFAVIVPVATVGGPQQVSADLRSSWTAFTGGFNEDRARRQHWASVAGGSPERKGRDVQSAKVRPVGGAFAGFFTGRVLRR